MEVGILGLAGSGKTTLFSLLTGSGSALAGGPRRDQATVGMGRVPDSRLDPERDVLLRKITPAIVRYDVPAVAATAERRPQHPRAAYDTRCSLSSALASAALPHPLPRSTGPRSRLIEEEFQSDRWSSSADRAPRKTWPGAAPGARSSSCSSAASILEEGRPLRRRSSAPTGCGCASISVDRRSRGGQRR
jgi:hypothetical protein